MPGMSSEAEDIRSVFKSGSVIFLGFVIESLIAFVAKAVAARYLVRADFGTISIGVAAFTLLGGVVLLGMKPGIVRYVPRADTIREHRGYLVSAYHITLAAVGVVSVLLFFIADLVAVQVFHNGDLTPIFHVVAVGLPFSTLASISLGVVRAEGLTAPKVIVQNFVMPVSRFLFIIAGVALGVQAAGIMSAYALSHAAGFVVILYFVYKHSPLFDSSSYESKHTQLVMFSLPLMFSSLLSQILSKADTLLIGVFRSSAAAGDYDIAYTLARLMFMILISFEYLFVPIFSGYHSDGTLTRARSFYKTITKWIFLGTLPLFFAMFLFPEFVIRFGFGNEYVTGALALQIVALGFIFHAAVGPNTGALQAFGYTKFILATDIVATGSNIILNLYLIPRYGIEGAAFATLFSYTARNLTQIGWLYWKQNISPMSTGLVKPAVASTILMIVLYIGFQSLFQPTVVPLLGLLIVAGSLYPVVIVAFGGIGEDELMIIESIEDRFDLNLSTARRLAERIR
jgi:O-antigen/teichoic acid export membrane protein